MKLWLLRHPRPAVPTGLCYGASDVPIEDDHLADLLESLPPRLPREATLYSSPLSRCLRLARGLEPLGWGPVSIDERLREMDFGAWEGRQWSALPREQIDAWRDDLPNYTPPGGEPLRDLATRGQAFCAALPPHRDALVVTHAGVIQTLLRTLRGRPLSGFGATRIEYGQLVVLERRDPGWEVVDG